MRGSGSGLSTDRYQSNALQGLSAADEGLRFPVPDTSVDLDAGSRETSANKREKLRAVLLDDSCRQVAGSRIHEQGSRDRPSSPQLQPSLAQHLRREQQSKSQCSHRLPWIHSSRQSFVQHHTKPETMRHSARFPVHRAVDLDRLAYPIRTVLRRIGVCLLRTGVGSQAQWRRHRPPIYRLYRLEGCSRGASDAVPMEGLCAVCVQPAYAGPWRSSRLSKGQSRTRSTPRSTG